MNSRVLLIVILLFLNNAYGQLDAKEDELKKQAKERPEGFTKKVTVNLALNQASFSNWSAGGSNSFSVSSKINYMFNYKQDNWIFDNYGSIGYGILDQENNPNIVKTDDHFEYTNKVGYKSRQKFYYAMLWNLRTQMTPGYDDPGDDEKVSDLLSPLYITGSVGLDFQKLEKLSVFASLLSTKMTFVYNQTMANAGAFGVDPAEYDDQGNITEEGSNFKAELGGYVKIRLQDNIMENVEMISNLDLFSNYLYKPQNIDINLELLLNMKINKYLTANISTNFIYDDDIKINDENNPENAGPRLQFKEILGIGISFTF
ncbi:MAG: DUF3078 domain-containing protein [Fidelibacterota bacterium]